MICSVVCSAVLIKELFSSYTEVWEALYMLRDKPWATVEPREVMPRPVVDVPYG